MQPVTVAEIYFFLQKFYIMKKVSIALLKNSHYSNLKLIKN